ncbi:FhaA domain-containing protein [Micromonospora sp. NPDC050686]|uniref:caspase, EACC1-associated type n=1 Tax=Micromonospora sp. NPDC050686 TaxID=3154631 RepID=UPI0033EBFD5A
MRLAATIMMTIRVLQVAADPRTRRRNPMTRLPDPARSRVVLVGTAAYHAKDLSDLPSVTNNVNALAEALTDPANGGFKPEHCVRLRDPAEPRDVSRALRNAAAQAEDTLLVYFAGHGMTGPRRHDLFLCTSDSDPTELALSALPYEHLRDVVLDSPANNRIVILDCCYSGRAAQDLMGDVPGVLDQLEIAGTWILAATPANAPALAPRGARYTVFTGHLLSLLTGGLHGGGELIALPDIYRQIRREMTASGMRPPHQRGTDTVDLLALTRNPAYIPGSDVRDPAEWIRSQLHAVPTDAETAPPSGPRVGPATRFESGLRGLVRRAFRRTPTGPLLPVELVSGIRDEVVERRTVLDGFILVPNRYVLGLSPFDWDRMKPYQEALTNELVAWLAEYVAEQQWRVLGELSIVVEVDPQLVTGRIRIVSRIEPGS